MEVRIGVLHSPKELSLELEGSPEQVQEQIEQAHAQDVHLLWMQDGSGRRVGIPMDKVAYVEISVDDDSHRVGFGR